MEKRAVSRTVRFDSKLALYRDRLVPTAQELKLGQFVLSLQFVADTPHPMAAGPKADKEVREVIARELEERQHQTLLFRFSPAQMEAIMGELDVIATVATSIAVDEQNRYLDSIGAVPVSRSSGDLEFERIHSGSPLELVLVAGSILGSSGAGLLGLVKLIEHVYNTPVRIEADRERLLEAAAESRLRRRDLEVRYRDQLRERGAPGGRG